ncbi:hypothetical protein P691DRAFT_783932 [Macrolepiota fuliginosa MF-IS2]|uniref:Uncharacterized protein n=1 Tax=Macrolepiota fuliginosa MF-IS2 TaxID=1400762 RepID=A0A9P5XSE4_9AGAR|nr:hypothetical protein P691DRAFT_783932 [Macrolepiota fuliginosa MF-IS2]
MSSSPRRPRAICLNICNALELGLDTVSKIMGYQPEAAPSCKFTVTFIHAKTTEEFTPTHPILECLHLDYSWKMQQGLSDDDDTLKSDRYDHPFSKDLTLPLQTLLDDVVIRFVRNGLVKRYPFVFGTVAQFSNETTYFQPMITSIKRIIQRSLNPAFNSQCRQLLKVFSDDGIIGFCVGLIGMPSHLSSSNTASISSPTRTHTGNPMTVKHRGRNLAPKRHSISQCNTYLGLGTHAYIMDVEEQELLETGPQSTEIPPDRTLTLPLDDLSLDQEDELGYGMGRKGGLSLFDTSGFPELVDTALTDFSTPGPDDILLDTDSDGGSDLITIDELPLFQELGVGKVSVDLGESDEDDLSTVALVQTPVYHLAASSGQNLPSALYHLSGDSLENITQPLPLPRGVFYVERVLVSPPQDPRPMGSYHRSSLGCVVPSHIVQAGSGDNGTSQAKGNMNHMSHLERSSPLLTSPREASITLDSRVPMVPLVNNEFSLDTDITTEEDDIDLWAPMLPEPTASGHEPTVNLVSNPHNHTVHQEGFFDVLSEVSYLDGELDIANQDGCDMEIMLNYIDCIIGGDAIAGPMIQEYDTEDPHGEEAVQGGVFLELVDEESELEGGRNRQNKAVQLHFNRVEKDCWLDVGNEAAFVELIT